MLVIKILMLIGAGGLLTYQIVKLVSDIKKSKEKPPNYEKNGDIND